MADTTYFRSPTKQELRKQKLDRKDANSCKLHILGALSSVVRNGGVYEEPEDQKLITDIPADFLPKARKAKPNAAESVLKRETTNHAYVADLRSRPAPAPAKRAVVEAAHPLALSWEATHHGRNDTTAVQSTLAYTKKGGGEVPAIYSPGEENPRRLIEQQRKEREAKKVPPRDKKPEPFVYQPKVTKLKPGEVPAVVEAFRPSESGFTEKRRPSTAGIHPKHFH